MLHDCVGGPAGELDADGVASEGDSCEPAGGGSSLALEYKHLPRLRDGTERRQPDVYVEFQDGARVAFECQLQSMGGTSRENSATHHDGRAEWRRRLDDCRELRDDHGINVIWIVSPWMSKGTPRLTRGNVWELNCFRTWAASMLAAGAQLYWLDPNFGQIGTLVDHIGRNNDGPGFLTAARDFPHQYKYHWLHSDKLLDCEIDPRTGAVTTPLPIGKLNATDGWPRDAGASKLNAKPKSRNSKKYATTPQHDSKQPKSSKNETGRPVRKLTRNTGDK